MTYKQVRWYLFTKSYAYTVFQEYIHKAKGKEKPLLRKRIAKVLLIQPNRAKQTSVTFRRNGKASVYVRIERELIRLITERKERGTFDLDEYEYALLEPAIERVVGEDLSDIEDDREFDRQLKIYKTLYQGWYYQIAAKYRLPTLRIIPFLLRLLFSKKLLKIHDKP